MKEKKKKRREEGRKKEKIRSKVWKSSVFIWYLSSFGIESIDTWFGNLYVVYGLGLETPKLISC